MIDSILNLVSLLPQPNHPSPWPLVASPDSAFPEMHRTYGFAHARKDHAADRFLLPSACYHLSTLSLHSALIVYVPVTSS